MNVELMLIQIDQENRESFSDLLTKNIMGDLELEACYGIGAAVKEGDVWVACGALVYMMDYADESHGFRSELKWLYVQEELREQGIGTKLMNRFYDIQSDLGTEDIFCRVPLAGECDRLAAFLEDYGFYFIIGPSNQMMVGKQDVLSVSPAEHHLGADYISMGADLDTELVNYFLQNNLEDFIDASYETGKELHSFDRRLSSVYIEDNKLKGILLCSLDSTGRVSLCVLHTTVPQNNAKKVCLNLIQKSVEALGKTPKADRVLVTIRTPLGAGLWDLLFPDLPPIDVRQGMYTGE